DPERVSGERRRRIRRDQLGAEDEQIVVGAVGRLVAEKGFLELFEAATELDDRYLVVVIGPQEPGKADALPRDALRSAEQAGVRFLGMRTDIEHLYSAMDLFVLPSHREGFPRSAMEAAATGLPVVASDIRGCREVVEPGVNGLLVPARDPEALATAIRILGDDPVLREKMGRAGRLKAEDQFDERNVVRIVMDTYRRALRSKGLFEVAQTQAPSTDTVAIRPAQPEDVPVLARLHASSISTGFLSHLGVRFLDRLYRALLGWHGSVVLVADDGSGPIGFVAGVTDIAHFYRHFGRRYGLGAGTAALPRLLRPSNLVRAWETWRYDGGDIDVPAELVSMAVAPGARGRGLGIRLGSEFLEAMLGRGSQEVKVVVGAPNARALGAYRKMGFVESGTIEVHAGEPSTVLVWSA
ncbi:MAG: GNAT family N-acetyltransferase, partial [Acidimicrobiia bacterium]